MHHSHMQSNTKSNLKWVVFGLFLIVNLYDIHRTKKKNTTHGDPTAEKVGTYSKHFDSSYCYTAPYVLYIPRTYLW